MNIHADTLLSILRWSENRPPWLRDALRRLVEKSTLDDTDIEELTALCCQQHATSAHTTVTLAACPLSMDHLPVISHHEAVSLLSIKDIERVNALTKQSPLSLGNSGLAIIYGDNASGKSGYARILKRACRARACGDRILSDVYSTPSTMPASAAIEFSIGSERKEVRWEDGVPADAALSEISVFDSACGTIQVRGPNEVAFVPFGLDLLERLANTCQRVQEKIKGEIARLEASRSFPEMPLRPYTRVGNVLAQLAHSTDINALMTMATLTEEESARLKQLQADMSQDPAKLAKRLNDEQQLLSELLALVRNIASALSQDALAHLQQSLKDWQAKAAAATLAAGTAFTGEPLPGAGSEVWQALWIAAQAYSEAEAYRGKPFPVTDEGSRCILCQQILNDEGRNRFHRFADFVRDATQKAAKEAKTKVDELVTRLEALPISDPETVFFGVEPDNESQDHQIRDYFASANARRAALIEICHGKELAIVPDLSVSPESTLDGLKAVRRERAAELRNASQESQNDKRTTELYELEARSYLSSNLQHIVKEIGRLKELHRLQLSLEDADTRSITNEAGRLAGQVLTDQLRDQFARELQRLNVRTARVELVHAGGRYGTQKYQIRLLARPDVPVAAILSEGEHTVISLAGFFSELTVAGHKSAIVFDDPITSLDHIYRRFVAKRLTEEAGERQVIVFTHDVCFSHGTY